MMRRVCMLLVAAAAAFLPTLGEAQGAAGIKGTWEGPWYRGMSSGVAKLQIADNSGTLQLTNAETFGEEPQPVVKLSVDGNRISLRADGQKGSPLTVELKLNDKGDQMKGMGKYEGFGVRLELRRTGG